MKKVLLVLILCVVINSFKTVFNASLIIASEALNMSLATCSIDEPEGTNCHWKIILERILTGIRL